MKRRGDHFNRCLRLPRSTFFVTEKLIIQVIAQVHRPRSREIQILNRKQLFSDRLRLQMQHMMSWQQMSKAQKKEIIVDASLKREAEQRKLEEYARQISLTNESDNIKIE